AVVVDNGADGDIGELARQQFGSFVELLEMHGNTGSAGGFKAGLQHALALSADYLFLLDDDNEIQPGCLASLRQAFARHAASVPIDSLATLAYRPTLQANAMANLPANGMQMQSKSFFGFNILDVPFKIFAVPPGAAAGLRAGLCSSRWQ
ncbi:MAG: glycosyltransferase family 2 protein, partial [Janthinobacterium lividum]